MKHFALSSHGDLAAYDYLWRLTPDRWAWEFLRRNPAFRRDAACLPDDAISVKKARCADIRLLRPRAWQTLADRWGLVLMPDPDRGGFEADVVWNRRAFPDQVEITCVPREPGERCEIWDQMVPSCDITHITDRLGQEFLILRRNGFAAQVRCTGTSILGLDPIRIKLTISRLRGYYRRSRLQKAAVEIHRDEQSPASPQWTKTTEILRNGLITLDGLAAGMSRKDIATLIHGPRHVRAEWHGPSLQHAMHYLVRKAEGLRDGRYLTDLLGAETIAS